MSDERERSEARKHRRRRLQRTQRPPWEPFEGQIPYDSRLAEARQLTPMVVEALYAFGEARWPRRLWAPWRRRFEIYFESADEGQLGRFGWYVVARAGWQDRLGKPLQRDYYLVSLRFSNRQDQPAVFEVMGRTAYLNRLSLDRVLQELLEDEVQPHRTDEAFFRELERLL